MMVDLLILCNYCDLIKFSVLLKLVDMMSGKIDEDFFFRGSEPNTEEAVELIRTTGGVAVLAHPWALKNPVSVIRRLTEAGLHGIEAYRSDGKLAGIYFLYHLVIFQINSADTQFFESGN